MKKIKLSAVILAVLLLLTACAPSYPNTKKGKEYGYFTYNGLEYGLSEEEFLAIMDDKAICLEEKYFSNNGDRYYQQNDAEFLGKKATIQYSFFGGEGIEPGLYDVFVIFEEPVEPNAMIEQIDIFVAQEGVEIDPEKEFHVYPEKEWIDLSKVDFTERDETRISVSYEIQTKIKGGDLNADMLQKAKENFARYGSENGSLDLIMEKGICALLFSCTSRYDSAGNPTSCRATISFAGTMWILEAYAALSE